jgi:hypothetical protein
MPSFQFSPAATGNRTPLRTLAEQGAATPIQQLIPLAQALDETRT